MRDKDELKKLRRSEVLRIRKNRSWEVMKMMIKMEMIAALSSKVRDGMDPHTFFNLYGDDRTLDQCT